MISLVIPEYVMLEKEFELVPDERSIKVKSQNSLKDYLQTKLWFEKNCSATIKYHPLSSDQNYTLQFVDWIVHCIWEKYEDGQELYFNELKHLIKIRNLFF